jgi:hypothetical protein
MSEIMKYKGRLLEKENKAKSLKLRISGDVTALRELLDPFVPVEKLKADVIAEQALELANKQIALKETLAEIEAIRDALGQDSERR